MSIFRVFLKILNKNKVIIILYTVILIAFGGINIKTENKNFEFDKNIPSIVIINEDENTDIVKHFINYMESKCKIIAIENNKELVEDALFFRDICAAIVIPKDFTNNLYNSDNYKIYVETINDSNSLYAQMLVNRYLESVSIVKSNVNDYSLLTDNISNLLKDEINIKTVSKLDTQSLSKVEFYYNFASYSIFTCLMYIVSTVVFSFKGVEKRTLLSNIGIKKYNRKLLTAISVFSIFLWLMYVVLSVILIGNIMFTKNGMLYILNLFVFTILATAFSFLISRYIKDKNSIFGFVNVISLGVSFLCGAFVPIEYLSSKVLKISKLLPNYYYIKTNDILNSMEKFDIITLKPVIINMLIVTAFSFVIIIICNLKYFNKPTSM